MLRFVKSFDPSLFVVVALAVLISVQVDVADYLQFKSKTRSQNCQNY
jgi:hypothetical protein